MRAPLVAAAFAALAVTAIPAMAQSQDIFDRVEHGYVDSGGVKIHYATIGRGPLVVMVHGFPDFWYSWRDQMAALSSQYQVVAIDQRGYNLSDKPKGQEQYDARLLVGDLRAVVLHFQKAANSTAPAVIVGHDWGGVVAWAFAQNFPDLTGKLIICNLPHPKGLSRELANNPEQQKNAEYARRFQQPGAESALTAEGLAARIADPAARAHYVEAFKRSDFEAMLNYYRQNYPRPPYQEDPRPPIKVKAPVLMIHGLADTALLASGINNTWEWIDNTFTLVTIPGAGHFVQNDAAAQVSAIMVSWLAK